MPTENEQTTLFELLSFYAPEDLDKLEDDVLRSNDESVNFEGRSFPAFEFLETIGKVRLIRPRALKSVLREARTRIEKLASRNRALRNEIDRLRAGRYDGDDMDRKIRRLRTENRVALGELGELLEAWAELAKGERS